MNSNKLSFEERQIRRRNQKVNSIRFKQGMKELFSKKSKAIIFLLYIIATIIIWFLLVYKPSNDLDIFKLLIYIVFWLVFGIFTFGIIIWFGKPKNAQKIEDDIKDVLKIEELHKVPILKAIIKKINGILTFGLYSPDYSKEKYEERRIDLEQKLGIVIYGAIESDGEFIYFDAIPKKSIKAKGELKDDRI